MRNRLLLAIGSFLMGIISAIAAPKFLKHIVDRTVFPDHWAEIPRKTSPDGVVDAVLISRDCGAPCSLNYSVYIVPKGHQVEQKADHSNFSADDVTGANLGWKQPRLLEVGYSRAFIIGFQNVAYPLDATNSQGALYRVEVRLAPTSPGFSYLTDSDTR